MQACAVVHARYAIPEAKEKMVARVLSRLGPWSHKCQRVCCIDCGKKFAWALFTGSIPIHSHRNQSPYIELGVRETFDKMVVVASPPSKHYRLSLLTLLSHLPGSRRWPDRKFQTMSSRLQDYRQLGGLLEVGMDDVKILTPDSAEMAIGTKGLNGCTCVVILGHNAILLAHISPLPGLAAGWERVSDEARRIACSDHHRRFLTTIDTLVRQYDRYFPLPNSLWGIFAVDGERGPMQAVADQIQTVVTEMDFYMQQTFYRVMNPRDARPPKGELIGVRHPNGPRLYLEGQQLWPKQQESTLVSSADFGAFSPSARTQEPGRRAEDTFTQTFGSYWAWSRTRQSWAFIAQGHGQRPSNKGPMPPGTARVLCTDDGMWKDFDFDTRTWTGN